MLTIIYNTETVTQLAIKWPVRFPPHPTYASTLPRESRSSKICVGAQHKVPTE